jgi:hypothetical protein
MITFYRPPCPKCKATATLARITPGRPGFDIRTSNAVLAITFISAWSRWSIR